MELIKARLLNAAELAKSGLLNAAELTKETFWNSKNAKIQSGAIILAFAFIYVYFTSIAGTSPPKIVSWTIAYIVLTVSWSFFSGKTGYISLATAAFYGIGMYIQAVYGRQIPLWGILILSAAVSFAVGYIIGVVTLRLRGIYFTIFTFGLVLSLNKFFHWYEGMFTRTKGRMVKPYDNETIFYATLIVLAITIIAMLLMNKSRFGLSLKCIGQNEDSAQHIGVKTTSTKVFAFAISAAPAGAIGAVMSSSIGYIDPDTAFVMNASFFPVLMAIFGGMGTVYGPIVGAVVFYMLQDYLIRATPFYMIIFGVIMVLVVLFMPKGVFGTINSIIAKARSKSEMEKVIGDG